MRQHFLLLARAGAWANLKLNEDLARLTPAQWAGESAVNFGSARGVANHLVLADRAWLFRFTGEGESVSTVDATPWPDFDGFRAAREETDRRILAFAEGLDEERIAGTLHYKNIKGEPCQEPFALCLAHFFNHQTFHRGQIHALLGVHGVKAGNLDIIYFPER